MPLQTKSDTATYRRDFDGAVRRVVYDTSARPNRLRLEEPICAKIINAPRYVMRITPIDPYRVGVATAQARPYYTFTKWLRDIGADFDVLEPLEMSGYGGHIMLTTRREAPPVCRCALLFPDELERGSAVALSLLLRRCGVFGDDLVVGIDPGQRLGLAVSYAGREVETALFTSTRALVAHVSDLLAGIEASSYTIRVGDGEMVSAAYVCGALAAADLPPFRLEFVNEAGTSPRGRNCNRRGKRDMLAARTIAQTGCGLHATVG